VLACASLCDCGKSPPLPFTSMYFSHPIWLRPKQDWIFSHIQVARLLHGTSPGPRRTQDGDGLELVFTCGLEFLSPNITTAWPTPTGHCRRVTPPPYTHRISFCVFTFIVIGLRFAHTRHSGNFASTLLSLTAVILETIYCFSKAIFLASSVVVCWHIEP
jgi:hypothetical protein